MEEIYNWNKILEEDLLLEMANVSSRVTGLPYNIWIDSAGVGRNNTHNEPRIKVKVNDILIPMTISDNPVIPESVQKTLGIDTFKDINIVKRYIKAYKKVLLAHYLGQIDDTAALSLLNTLPEASKAELKLADMIDLRPNIRLEYYWDENELLYVMTVKTDNGILATRYALDNYEFACNIEDFRKEFGNIRIIDINNPDGAAELLERLNL